MKQKNRHIFFIFDCVDIQSALSSLTSTPVEIRRNSSGTQLPAKYIRATSVKSATLNPVWEEKFKFDLDDQNTDCFHLDIWDHDDEESVIEAVGKLNQVKGVKGMRRFFKQIAQSARGSDQDDFLGCITLAVQDIPSTGLDTWYKLAGRSLRSQVQGSIHLKIWLSSREDRGLSEEEDNKNELQQQFHLYHIFINHAIANLKGGISEWDGSLCQAANTILHQHAIQGDINNLQVATVHWRVLLSVAKGDNLDLEILYSSLRTIEQRWDKSKLSKDEEAQLAASFTSFIDDCLEKIKDLNTWFPHNRPSAKGNLEYMLRCLYQLSEMKTFSSCCPFNKEIRSDVILAIKKGVTDRFRRLVIRAGGEEADIKNRTGTVSLILEEVIQDLDNASCFYDKIFDSTMKVHYTATIFKQLNRLICERVYPILVDICQEDDQETEDEGFKTLIQQFQLCHEFRRFQGFGEGLSRVDKRGLNLNRFQEYFVPAFNLWLDKSKPKLLERVYKCLELDHCTTQYQDIKYTTSAIDLTASIYQIKEVWTSMKFTKSENTQFLEVKLFEVLSEAIVLYTDHIHNGLEESGYYEQDTPTLISDQMCTAVNNLEHVFKHFECSASELGMSQPLSQESSERSDYVEINPVIEQTLAYIDSTVYKILSKILIQMEAGLKKNVFHLAWSPDSLPIQEAISPLITFLTIHLTSLNGALLAGNFRRCLVVLWQAILERLREHTDPSTGEKTQLFYDRLHDGVQILSEYFQCDGKGLKQEEIYNQSYANIDMVFGHAKLSTDQLIAEYYKERLNDQYNMGTQEFGVLSVRVYFRHDNLSIEIISAKDVIPLDPNGLSDPYVTIELLPKFVFPKCPELVTAVQKATLQPSFEETFEFNIRREQCRDHGSVICFTLMDYDVLTANDFGGEAFISLSSVPGVEQGSSTVDNFHGLKPIHLPLMFQKNKEHPILHTLELRKNDKAAQEFIKKQKFRFQE
ncbi:BAI1-associated protein 3 [Eurytemora carolleeae]|uniref:BAI1-associated protein 3 n=1 Tax=Eurytemora carolleeae TaxID=1294199 RepID=UPI000C77B4C8|nr:BAI1-associated protein 3 [Eurytemora carolleeae]|eukprot:XP_023321251.1 BAI1-associated protein 3-like [Eurytemora affinis]